MTAMWLMLLVFGVDPWVGIVPALAYGLSTYFLLIVGAGITKMVGAGLCPADDGRCVDDPAGKHVGGRCAHGAHGVARNRRQPPADHLLFPPGHVRLLDQRGDRGLQGETPRGLLETHGGTRRRRRYSPQGRISRPCGTPPATPKRPCAAAPNWPRPPRLRRTG